MVALTNPVQLSSRLRDVNYVPDEGIATVTHLALALHRPLLLEGEPGTGKTALASALAKAFDIPLIRLQCYEGIDAQTALYDWDFARQILHLNTIKSLQPNAQPTEVENNLYSEQFLLRRPILQALQASPAVLLIDEIDRADDEFEALLLEVLSEYQVSIPEFGTVTAKQPPIVVLTSNRTRDLHDALKRRCLYHWVEHPSLEREMEILAAQTPEVSEKLSRRVIEVVHQLRQDTNLRRAPGVAETIDWVRAIHALGKETIDLDSAISTLGALTKSRDDIEYLESTLDAQLRI